MKNLFTMTVFATLLVLSLAAPAVRVQPIASEYSRVTDRHRVIMQAASESLSPSEHLEIAEAAAELVNLMESVEKMTSVDVDPEENDFLDFSTWDSPDTKVHCVRRKQLKDVLSGLFEELVQMQGYKKRNARAILRELYHMTHDVQIEGKAAKCFTFNNYEEILDLVVTLSPSTQEKTYLIVPSTSPVDQRNVVAASEIAKTAFVQQHIRKTAPKPLDESTKEKMGKIQSLESLTNIKQTYSCPYHYEKCCLSYRIPGIENPQAEYLSCCFVDVYPTIAALWDSFYGQFYPTLNPATYSYIFCTLPAF